MWRQERQVGGWRKERHVDGWLQVREEDPMEQWNQYYKSSLTDLPQRSCFPWLMTEDKGQVGEWKGRVGRAGWEASSASNLAIRWLLCGRPHCTHPPGPPLPTSTQATHPSHPPLTISNDAALLPAAPMPARVAHAHDAACSFKGLAVGWDRCR